MGQDQSSTRRITVVNDEASGAIKISDSVVQRLRDEMNKPQASSEPSSASSSSTPAPPPPPQAAPPPPPQPQAPPPPPPPQYQQQPPPPPPPQQQQPSNNGGGGGGYDGSSLSALKVRAEKEEELRYVEGYWQDRVKKLRDGQLKREEVNEEAFRETVDAVDKLFLKTLNKPICQERRHGVLKCYQKNQGKSLLCADEVSSFVKCVESARLGSVGRTG